MLAVLAVSCSCSRAVLRRGHLTVFGAARRSSPCVVLLLELGMLRSQDVWEQLRSTGSARRVAAARLRDRGERARRQLVYVLARSHDRAQGAAVSRRASARCCATSRSTDTSAVERSGSRQRSCSRIVLSASRSWAAPGCGLGRGRASASGARGRGRCDPRVVPADDRAAVRPSQLLGFLALENGASLASLW